MKWNAAGFFKSPMLSTITLIMLVSCKRNPVGPQVTANVQLSAEYVACNEVWLKLAFADSPAGGDYVITRDGSAVLEGNFTGSSIAVRDSTVQAGRNYTYTALRLSDRSVAERSALVQVTTLDSTNSDFTWTSYVLGGGSFSTLNDVSLINDTTAFAVGEIFSQDSTGQISPLPYNLVRWNGIYFNLEKIQFPLCDANGNQGGSGPFGGNGILGLSSNDVWLSCGASLVHWNGQNFEEMCMPLGYGTRDLGKMWGKDDRFYLVGTNGFAAKRNENASGEFSWENLETGTIASIDDVWGMADSMTGMETVFCAVTSPVDPYSNKILRITSGSTVDTVTWDPSTGVFSVWTCPGAPLYAGGYGLWRNIDGAWEQINLNSRSVVAHIRGNGPNDVFAVGTFGLLAHYNGSTWKVFSGVTSATLFSVSVKGNVVIAVGVLGQDAAIVVGRRQ